MKRPKERPGQTDHDQAGYRGRQEVRKRPRNVYRSALHCQALIPGWLKWTGGGHQNLDDLFRQTMAQSITAASHDTARFQYGSDSMASERL